MASAQTVDCSNSANRGDVYCQFAANIEKGCNCFDGLDNDGDGLTRDTPVEREEKEALLAI